MEGTVVQEFISKLKTRRDFVDRITTHRTVEGGEYKMIGSRRLLDPEEYDNMEKEEPEILTSFDRIVDRQKRKDGVEWVLDYMYVSHASTNPMAQSWLRARCVDYWECDGDELPNLIPLPTVKRPSYMLLYYHHWERRWRVVAKHMPQRSRKQTHM